MKTLIAILIAATLTELTVSGQYRYNSYSFSLDSAIAPLSVSNYNSIVSIAQGSQAQVLLSFNMHTTTNFSWCTNLGTAILDLSVDSTHWTNTFYVQVNANSNNAVWGMTNLDVSSFAWIRLVGLTNGNPGQFLTNPVIFLGQKVGL